MSEPRPQEPDAAPPPHVQVIQMASSLWVSRLLYLAAKLGLADLITAGTDTYQALAAKTNSHERSMQRVLRALGCIGIVEQTDGTGLIHDPSHPDADQNGNVRTPNVNTVVEMTDLITATRAYEANVQAINATKRMSDAALGIGG